MFKKTLPLIALTSSLVLSGCVTPGGAVSLALEITRLLRAVQPVAQPA